LSPQIAMVTSATVPNNWMPAGVTPCACQYLQWGYWTGRVQRLTPSAHGFVNQFGSINTWIAGQPTVNLPATGVGAYNGAAVGTVFNSGATYLAAGGFNQMYNFAKQTGTVNITNFDNANYTATVLGFGNQYASGRGGLTGPANRNGFVLGSFYGPSAQETGGTFGIQSISGPKYLASGIFAGR
jgi:trimeric autotransporter adhesin